MKELQNQLLKACHALQQLPASEQQTQIVDIISGVRFRMQQIPKIVCLCGPTRFWKTFQEQSLFLTKQGFIVLSIGCATASDDEHGITPEEKALFDELHKRKIDLCDEVLILNVGGYIGESTRSELEYALANGKPVNYLS